MLSMVTSTTGALVGKKQFHAQVADVDAVATLTDLSIRVGMVVVNQGVHVLVLDVQNCAGV